MTVMGGSGGACGASVEGSAAGAAGSGSPAVVVGERRNLLAVSPTHACAVRKAGLYCWGMSIAGELGTGEIKDSPAPVAATVAGADVVEIGANTGRTCVRRSTGELACWGVNEQGQIGDGTRNPSLTPVPAAGITDAMAMALDDASTCVLRRDQTVACWGMSPMDSPEAGSLLPLPISGLTRIVELKNGMMGSYCARNAQDAVFCWRFMEGKWTPAFEVPALAGSRMIALAAWDEICGVADSGSIQCHNFDSRKTVTLQGSESSKALTASGTLGACGQSASGQWQCWNILPPLLEALGSVPVKVLSPVPLRELVISGFYGCSLAEDSSVACENVDNIGLMPMPETAELTPITGLPL